MLTTFVPKVRGEVTLFDMLGNGSRRKIVTIHNDFMYSGADIMAKLASGDSSFKIATMYFEFENGAPGAIVEPTIDLTDGTEYFTALSSPRDYLRVPLTINPSFSADTDYDNNKVTFFGVSSGSTGENGLAFSEAAGSYVYGGALVASPDIGDATDDRIFARSYWASTPAEKHTGRQIGMQWTVTFTAE